MNIAHNFKEIHYKIQKTARQWVRDPQTIELVAVSKKQPIERIIEALETGHRVFGENNIQDAKKTWERKGLKTQYPDVKLHFIGSLQTNKVKDAVTLFECIETIDRPNLVDAVVKEMKKQDKKLMCFIQVNTGEESQKSGVFPSALPSLLCYAQEAGLEITGLMCIPPQHEPSALHFAFLKKLAQAHGLKNLSMGMSHDFEKAIPLHATYLRIGTSLFGTRKD